MHLKNGTGDYENHFHQYNQLLVDNSKNLKKIYSENCMLEKQNFEYQQQLAQEDIDYRNRFLGKQK
jgi:hypothetical protein